MELNQIRSLDPPGDPMHGSLLTPPASTGERASNSGDRPIKLLLVEHDLSYAQYVIELLGAQNYKPMEIEWTRWLDAAIRRIQEGRADAVLLDISLPDISGVEIFRAVHRADPHMPVLVMADLDDETMACRLIREGAQDYLSKDALNQGRLYRSVRFSLERSKARGRGSKGRVLTAEGNAAPGWIHDAESASICSQPSRETIRILIVEHSDKDYGKFQACIGGHKEIRMTRAKSIHSAFRSLSRQNFDLVCLDYFLPDGTGHDFLTKMKQSGMDIPAVVITSHTDPMIAAQIIQTGAISNKPSKRNSAGLPGTVAPFPCA